MKCNYENPITFQIFKICSQTLWILTLVATITLCPYPLITLNQYKNTNNYTIGISTMHLFNERPITKIIKSNGNKCP